MKTIKIIYFAIGFLFFFLILYLLVFHHGFSEHHEEWGSFGSYIGGIGGIILSCSIFYYTYLIDKEHRKTENNTQTLKLLEVVGESLTCIQRWKELSFKLATENTWDRGIPLHEHMEYERKVLQMKIWTNYKSTQVMANHLYGMNIPNVDTIDKTEDYFISVFNKIKQ